MINPILTDLLSNNDVLDVLKLAVTHQIKKMQNMDKTEEGREWKQDIPDVIKTKFDEYLKDFVKLSLILEEEQDTILDRMNKGYYYWRLLRSACNTYQIDLKEYDMQLFQEFSLKNTKGISDNDVLKKCISVLEEHADED